MACATVSPILARSASFKRGRRALLPDLLMAPLQRTVAFAEMDGMAEPVAKNLNLDVTRLLEIFFEIDGVVAECGLGFGSGASSVRRKVRQACARLSCRGRRRRPLP